MTYLMLPQATVGQVNIVGECWCLGAILDHDVVPVYLDLAGPATSVEAAWAKLVQGKELAIVRYGGKRSLYLQSTKEGQLARFQRRIPGLRVDHLILVHRSITQPVYHEKSTTYILRASDEQARAKLGAHIAALVHVAVFAEWHAYLEQRGREEDLLRACMCYGGVEAVAVELDRDAWTRVISSGLEQGEIALP